MCKIAILITGIKLCNKFQLIAISRPVEIKMRDEGTIFSDIEELCLTDGYIYVLAWICFRDDIIIYKEQMQVSDMEHLFSQDRLIRTELSTLSGLMAKGSISLDCPSGDDFQRLVDKTDALMKELHDAFIVPFSEDELKAGLDGYLQKGEFYRGSILLLGRVCILLSI